MYIVLIGYALPDPACVVAGSSSVPTEHHRHLVGGAGQQRRAVHGRARRFDADRRASVDIADVTRYRRCRSRQRELVLAVGRACAHTRQAHAVDTQSLRICGADHVLHADH